MTDFNHIFNVNVKSMKLFNRNLCLIKVLSIFFICFFIFTYLQDLLNDINKSPGDFGTKKYSHTLTQTRKLEAKEFHNNIENEHQAKNQTTICPQPLLQNIRAKPRLSFLTIKHACFSFSGQGHLSIIFDRIEEIRNVCKHGVLNVCVPNYVHGSSKTCQTLSCAYQNSRQLPVFSNKTVNIVSSKMHHFGWHAFLDNFIHYYYTFACTKQNTCSKNFTLTDTCLQNNLILFTDMNRKCAVNNAAFFLFGQILSSAENIVELQKDQTVCFENAQIGRLDAPFKYNELLRKMPFLFKSLTKCATKWAPFFSATPLSIIFLNRETVYGPRHVLNLEEIANISVHKFPRAKVLYYDGLVHFSLKTQFDIFDQNFATVVSPHGSQLTWVLFLKSSSTVVEIFGEDKLYFHKTDYKDICTSVGITYVKWNANGGIRTPREKLNKKKQYTFIRNHSIFISKLHSIVTSMTSSHV